MLKDWGDEDTQSLVTETLPEAWELKIHAGHISGLCMLCVPGLDLLM